MTKAASKRYPKANAVHGLAKSQTTHELARVSVRSSRGFSIIELVVVMSIGLVLMAFATSSFTESRRSLRIKNDSRNLANLLNFARMKGAASFSRSQVLCDITKTPTMCSIILFDPTYTGGSAGQTALNAQAPEVALSPGVSLTVPSGITTGPPGTGQATASPLEGQAGETQPPTGTAFTVNFNSRGLPIYSPTNTSPDSGYAYYLTDTTGNCIAITVDLGGSTTLWQLDLRTSTWVKMLN